jgi:hypothetical protein
VPLQHRVILDSFTGNVQDRGINFQLICSVAGFP